MATREGLRAADAMVQGADFDNRVIYLIGTITEEQAYRFIVNLTSMERVTGGISVLLSSSGGDEAAGFAIYDAIALCNRKVTVHGLARVQSIAAVILQAGTKRLLSPECRFMVHHGSVGIDGDIDMNTLISIGKEAERVNETYQRLLATRSCQPIQLVRELCQKETYLTAREAVRLGFADELMARSTK